MADSEERPLPDPHDYIAARNALDHAAEAAWRAKRMLATAVVEPVLGCGAGVMSAVGTQCLLMEHSPNDWTMLLWGNGAIWFFLIWGGRILWQSRRPQPGNQIFAEDRGAACRRQGLRPLNLIVSYAFVIASFAFWMWVFPRLSNLGILTLMTLAIGATILPFILRFCQLRFWEDLLFGAAIAIPWGLYLGRVQGAALIAMAASLSTIVGIWSLRQRWKRFTRTGRSGEASPETPVLT